MADLIDDSRQPSDLEWSERQEGLRSQFVVAPPRLNALPMLVFAGIWDSFMVFFYVGLSRAPNVPWVALLFPIGHVLAGIFITWLALVKTLNRSRLTIDRDAFVLEHSPIWARGARFATRDVEGFDLYESKKSRGGSSWQIRVLTRDGKATKLALPLDEREHVGFVTAKLRAALALTRESPGYRELA